ncbi:sigma-54 dependent transcriptional regulator [bacterium]|nr:sigma-54 dependent transcriptional regulator [bacterium]
MKTRVPRILVVDDEPVISEMLSEFLGTRSYEVVTESRGVAAIEQLKNAEFDLIITDLCLPDIDGMEILRNVKQIDPDTGVVMITAHSSVEGAVEAMRIGAFDYLTKGFSLEEIEVTIEKFFKYQSLLKENQLLRSELGALFGIDNIIGNSHRMQVVFDTMQMVAPTNATVLITGASGTGKELVAKALHDGSLRRDQPFVKTNCAAMPEGLVESELFGHEKGAFTGAVRSTKGRFELADGGTLLLDEISEIRPTLQAKLLRVLQEKEFEKVGNPETVKVNVRIIATTNRDLAKEIEEGNFREDLFYRLNVVPINLPPLKERAEDIPLLVDYFVEKYANENNRTIKSVDEAVMQQLVQYDWPGNVRELENTIERAVVICKDGTIQTKHLFWGTNNVQFEKSNETPIGLPSGMTLKKMEELLIMQTLKERGGNRTWAAKQLGVSVRTLRNKLREYRQDGVVVDDESE